ncbi:MAG: hypothetical protein GYA24_10100 [Candidatus Lokiarchaeota archaeon]|nr:hypothetical protein [Candidatus Lokiarchaeota archaeon]
MLNSPSFLHPRGLYPFAIMNLVRWIRVLTVLFFIIHTKFKYIFEEESFWEAIDALCPPALNEDDYSMPRNFPTACLDCVTGAMFSLVIAPGGH